MLEKKEKTGTYEAGVAFGPGRVQLDTFLRILERRSPLLLRRIGARAIRVQHVIRGVEMDRLAEETDGLVVLARRKRGVAFCLPKKKWVNEKCGGKRSFLSQGERLRVSGFKEVCR